MCCLGGGGLWGLPDSWVGIPHLALRFSFNNMWLLGAASSSHKRYLYSNFLIIFLTTLPKILGFHRLFFFHTSLVLVNLSHTCCCPGPHLHPTKNLPLTVKSHHYNETIMFHESRNPNMESKSWNCWHTTVSSLSRDSQAALVESQGMTAHTSLSIPNFLPLTLFTTHISSNVSLTE